MNTIHRKLRMVVVAVALIGLVGCGGMSRQDKNTAYGAAAGGAAGALITGGGALGTLGGAAAGGLIGRQLTKDKDKN